MVPMNMADWEHQADGYMDLVKTMNRLVIVHVIWNLTDVEDKLD